ncbi:serine/threonine protein kinase [Magnaporthiopsis poae ATCC 64411]|uniref:mitogen-activated protein kinase kinase n=1 Tax=Magnaporthiopsis poae (strain ATCC 64411 / 73-15) TaxID=644358 RepID=A0A0C4DYZ5_MAGP6|nr:serine/threonine protein kinase [Magnaporthiopsis poae ATCC 64411]
MGNNCVRHTFLRPGRSAGERFVKVEEQWVREAKLGEGAHGIVYRERLEGHATLRAVKEIKKNACAELDYSRELEANVKFSHFKYAHCFVISHGWFEIGDSIFISMEYLALGNLEGHISQPLAEIEARSISSQVLEGLKYMHENDFVHRDLKPGNIMVASKTPEWFVKISDFGVSKRQLAEATLQYTSKWLSVNYAAPEQFGFKDIATSARKSPFAMDIWSLGAVAFRLLTNSVPFQLGDLTAYVGGRQDTFPISKLQASGVSEEGIRFVVMAMRPLPESRPSASDAPGHPWFSTKLAPAPRSQGPSDGQAGTVHEDTQDSDVSGVWTTARAERATDGYSTQESDASGVWTTARAERAPDEHLTHASAGLGNPQAIHLCGGSSTQVPKPRPRSAGPQQQQPTPGDGSEASPLAAGLTAKIGAVSPGDLFDFGAPTPQDPSLDQYPINTTRLRPATGENTPGRSRTPSVTQRPSLVGAHYMGEHLPRPPDHGGSGGAGGRIRNFFRRWGKARGSTGTADTAEELTGASRGGSRNGDLVEGPKDSVGSSRARTPSHAPRSAPSSLLSNDDRLTFYHEGIYTFETVADPTAHHGETIFAFETVEDPTAHDGETIFAFETVGTQS